MTLLHICSFFQVDIKNEEVTPADTNDHAFETSGAILSPIGEDIHTDTDTD